MSQPAAIFVTRALALDPEAFVAARAVVRVFGHDRQATFDEIVEGARGASALVSMPTDRVDARLLDALPGLRVVANHAVGYDNVDVAAARARGIAVTHTPGVLTDATAELTWALLLAAARRVGEGERMVRAGGWHGWSPTSMLGTQLRGKTLGIYGLGRIGARVARIGHAFGMRVIAFSRTPALDNEPELGRVPFAELLAESDVLSIHCRLTPETSGSIGASELSQMKRGAILINTARGPIIDESALAHALSTGHLAAAGLDVYQDEPRVPATLRALENVVLLPHVGSATHEARRAMGELALRDALLVIEGKPPVHPVPIGEPNLDIG